MQSLASLVAAGIPLEKALTVTERVAPGPLREALRRIGTRIREGTSLGSALRAEAGVWSGVTVGLVRAGESGAGLVAALNQASAQLEREAETIANIRGALAYPLLLASVGTVSISIIVVFVVPRFVSLFDDVGQTLPLATRGLIAASDLVRHFGIYFAACAAALIVVVHRRLSDRRQACHEWLLRLPIIGPLRHAFATARASRALSALLGSGTPALAALTIAQEATGDAAIIDRLAQSRDLVAQGSPLSAALGTSRALTEGAVQLVAIGEGSGRLSQLLAKAADLEEREAERRLKTMVTFLEPALILAFAGLVAFVAAALLQAVYSLRPGGM
jgi:type II secretory pathway component PulF